MLGSYWTLQDSCSKLHCIFPDHYSHNLSKVLLFQPLCARQLQTWQAVWAPAIPSARGKSQGRRVLAAPSARTLLFCHQWGNCIFFNPSFLPGSHKDACCSPIVLWVLLCTHPKPHRGGSLLLWGAVAPPPFLLGTLCCWLCFLPAVYSKHSSQM